MQRYPVHFIRKLLYMFRVETSTHHQERKQLSTASGTYHTVTAICRYRERVGTV